MKELSRVAQYALSSKESSLLKEPLLYLSSSEAGWEGVSAQAFHEPAELGGWVTSGEPGISLIVFDGGAMHMERRQINGAWRGACLRKGDLMLQSGISPDYELRWQALSSIPTRTLHLRLDWNLLTRTAAEIADTDPTRLTIKDNPGFQDPLLTQVGFALWHELEQSAPAGKLYAQTASQMLAVHLLRRYTSVGEGMKVPTQGLTATQLGRVTDFVQTHLGEDLSLEALAQQAGFSPYHFARLFRRTTGESPHQFVLRQKFERAQQLIQGSDMPLAQIALECGFASQSHLTQTFKRYLDQTPRDYRQRFTIRAGF